MSLGIYNLQFTIYKSFIYLYIFYRKTSIFPMNLQIGCKFTNDKGTSHWSHTEPLISTRIKKKSIQFQTNHSDITTDNHR